MGSFIAMRQVAFTLGFLLVAMAARAAEPAKPKTLTPQEIADGWLLLFDGETTFGWKTEGEAKVKDGTLVLGGDKVASVMTTTEFSFYTLRVEFRPPAGDAGIVLNQQRWNFHNWGGGLPAIKKLADADGWVSGEWSVLPGDVASSHALKGRYGRGRDSISFGAGSNLSWNHGPIGFTSAAGQVLALRSIKLKPLGLKAIFNGKDLAGWNKYEGDKGRSKSQFTVTPEGWLNVKNGPGDLQTEGQWADFVLQLECISNGEHLNSGIFFRCRPGEYQQGYEAQIRNQFTKEPTQDYTIEEYDPASHKQTGKKKVKSPAVDYGTGAIYRRRPARKEVARDHEWFTMTVVARGRDIATWVNGYQQTDWTDNRPPADNARNGCRLEKGPISIQGHDPTTDLSFRNIRIAELPLPAGGK
jgi:hypothetical protein